MHKRPLVKICGIKNTLLLHELKTLGVNYIGLVFHPTSKRYVDLNTAKKISLAAKENNLIPVGVFVDHSAKEMEEICLSVNLNTVQLHGELCKKEHHLLPEHHRRIYVQLLGKDGKVLPDSANGLQHCDPNRDFLMFDSGLGTGKRFNWKNFSYQGEFRWFLAGGLTPENVREGIELLHPNGVDISGGVENQMGEKDINLIRHFVNAVSK